ncbi:hypothetical protein [Halosegnis marinus]|uniref:Uncharacterized protein n=1 Tax=Halosegnis marinus TaxID=3034023 RepID=A0ABD5ZMR3_9EURY|nr:hypothetical protein [Halosegnis sp. DT85]
MDDSGLVEALRERYDGSLLAVATYSADGYTLHFTADRVEENYSALDIEAIYDDVVLQDIAQPFQEQLFGDMGDIRGKLRLFENGTVAHFWPSEEREGAFVAFRPDADLRLRDLYGVVAEHYS